MPAGGPAADAWAAEFGRSLGLGQLTGAHQRPAAGDRRWDWGFGIALLGLVLAVAAALAGPPGGSAAAEAIVLAAAAGLVATGVTLIRTARAGSFDRIFTYPGGIIAVAAGRPEPRVIRWDGLAGMSYAFSDDAPGGLAGIRVAGRDGTVIWARRDYGEFALLAGGLDRAVVRARLPAAREQCRSGAGVRLGDLSVFPDGIGWDHAAAGPYRGPQWLPWPEVRSLEVTRERIWLGPAGGGARREIDLRQVPDSLVAILLVQEVAAAFGQIRREGPPVEVPLRPLGPPPWTRSAADTGTG
jgi:hypothetical protein